MTIGELSPQAVVEAAVTVLAVIGNFYVAHKRIAGLWIWLASNLIAFPFMLSVGLYGMAVQYAIFSGTTVYAILKWREVRTT